MNEEYYINLIYKHIEGLETPEEKEELDVWLNQSEENELLYKSVKAAWEHSNLAPEVPDVDLDAEFANLQEKLGDEEEEKVISINRLERKPVNTRWIGIAASIVVLFGLSWFFKDSFFGPEWKEINSKTEIVTVQLEDNSVVILNANSTIRFQEEFEGDTRDIELEGEAFFTVMRNENKPFIVKTDAGEVKVLGTSFNVRAYENEDNSRVFVKSGKVSFSSNTSDEKITLIQNNEGVLNKKDNSLVKKEMGSANTLSWMQKELSFKEAPLTDVLADIEKHYQIRVVDKLTDKDCTFTGTLAGDNLKEVFETLSIVFDIEFEETSDSTYELTGKGCK